MTTSRNSSCLRRTVKKMRFLGSCRFLMVVVTSLVLCFALRKVLLLHRSAPVVSPRLTWSAKSHGHRWRHLPVHIVEEHHEGRKLLSENMHAFILSLFCKLTCIYSYKSRLIFYFLCNVLNVCWKMVRVCLKP